MKPGAAGIATALAIVAASLLATGATARAGTPAAAPSLVWTPIAPTVDGRPIGDPPGLAGRVSAVAVIPGSHPVELVGTLGGVWRRTYRSAWRDVTGGDWPATSISSLAVDPGDPSIVYAGTGYDDIDASDVQPGAGILKSVDAGRHWTPLASSEPLMRGYAVTGLAVDPTNSRIVVAATNAGVFRSSDAGRSWLRTLPVPVGTSGIAEVHLAVDARTGAMLVGVAQASSISARTPGGSLLTGHAVYRSADHGRTWSAFAVDRDPVPGDVVAVALASRGGRHPATYAYALDVTGDTTSGLYVSSDGQGWRRMTDRNIITKFSIGQLIADPAHPSTAYFAQESYQPFRYTFGSHTSRTAGQPFDGCEFGDFRALGLGPALGAPRHEALYGGNDGGTCYLDLRTGQFSENNGKLISGLVYDVSATSPTREVSGAQDLGVDLYGGATSSKDLYNADGYGVLIDRTHPSRLFASVNPPGPAQRFIVSKDRGVHWRTVSIPSEGVFGDTIRLVQAQGAPQLLILPTQSRLYVSSDDGGRWHVRAIPLTGGDYVTAVRAALFAGKSGPVIYAGTGFGRLWRSGDLGTTWQQLPANFGPLSVRDLALDPEGSSGPGAEHLYVGLGVYASWAYASYATDGDVQETHNSGQAFTDIGSAVGRSAVNALLLDGSDLLAGTDFGVERYRSGTWARAFPGLPSVRVNDLERSADGRAIFAGTFGRGTWRVLTP